MVCAHLKFPVFGMIAFAPLWWIADFAKAVIMPTNAIFRFSSIMVAVAVQPFKNNRCTSTAEDAAAQHAITS